MFLAKKMFLFYNHANTAPQVLKQQFDNAETSNKHLGAAVSYGSDKAGWLNIIIVSICLAFSALYELIEWWVALATGENAEAFLGTQGSVWDTQSDMALALAGVILSLVLLSKLHDKQLTDC